jgi:choline dehydrogenase
MRKGSCESLRRDYGTIIVGAGAAGIRLASELVQRGDRDVLLLEAGASHAGPQSRVPAYYPCAFGGRLDWCYTTVPQRHLGGRRIPLPSGKGLGGSTSINAMIWIEPSDGCLLELQEAGGARWGLGTLREELASMRYDLLGEGYLGTPALHPNTRCFDLWLRQELGEESSTMERACLGVGAYRRTQQRGRRVSSAALLRRLAGKLTVLTEAQVEGLEWSGERVIGVKVRLAGESVTMKGAQVVLCCGAIGTPLLLLQSGVGPAEILREAGLAVRHALEGVGVGLQDHLIYPMVYRLGNGEPFGLPMSDDDRRRYVQDGEGPKGSNLSEYGGFFDPFVGTQGVRVANCGGLASRDGMKLDSAFQWHVTPTNYLRYPRYRAEYPAISVGVSLCKPRSRGRVWVRRSVESGTSVELQVDPNYFGDPGDLDALHDAVLWTRGVLNRLIASTGGAEWVEGSFLRGVEEVFPGKARGEELVAATMRKFSTTLYHYSSSCRLGRDPVAPVDSWLRVKGLEGLYVCDASVLPSVLGCNPQATVQLLAKRLATWL